MLYKIINTYADESDFILNLIDDHPYIGWYMLLILCKEYMCFVVKMQWDQIRNTDIEELICEDDLKMKKQLQDMFENKLFNVDRIAYEMMNQGMNISWIYPEMPVVANEIESRRITV